MTTLEWTECGLAITVRLRGPKATGGGFFGFFRKKTGTNYVPLTTLPDKLSIKSTVCAYGATTLVLRGTAVAMDVVHPAVHDRARYYSMKRCTIVLDGKKRTLLGKRLWIDLDERVCTVPICVDDLYKTFRLDSGDRPVTPRVRKTTRATLLAEERAMLLRHKSAQ